MHSYISTFLFIFFYQVKQTLDKNEWILEFWCLTPLSAIFQLPYIMATSFSGGGSQSTRREPPTMGCKSSAPFFVIYKAGRELTPYWW